MDYSVRRVSHSAARSDRCPKTARCYTVRNLYCEEFHLRALRVAHASTCRIYAKSVALQRLSWVPWCMKWDRRAMLFWPCGTGAGPEEQPSGQSEVVQTPWRVLRGVWHLLRFEL